MKKTYKAPSIACGSCANLIKVSLEDEFNEIIVNLDTTPKEVTVEIENEEQERKFFKEMDELGFTIQED